MTNDASAPASTSPVIPRSYLAPFILVTTLFALWGFANNVTDPMVAAFKNVLLLTNTQSSLVQSAFYGGYCVMAIPAALFIRRFGFKPGILLGLALYVIGCFLFLPASWTLQFPAFLIAYFVMTSGLAFLETTANPYILMMGPAETAPRRLNFAQAFNPIGSLMGMFVARDFILGRLNEADEPTRRAMVENDLESFAAIQAADVSVIAWPYMILGLVVLGVLIFFALSRLPAGESEAHTDGSIKATLGRLLTNYRYVGGVIAQACNVGAQIMCWTFIIQYGKNELGMAAEDAQSYNIVAMLIFVSSRFICTYLLKFFKPGPMLAVFGLAAAGLVAGTMFLEGMPGLYCLIGVSACLALMFPTIYGIALGGLGDDAKLGSAGLICAIGGGCVMPPLQASIMDGAEQVIGGVTLSATRASFVLPLICFLVVAAYGAAVAFARPLPSENA